MEASARASRLVLMGFDVDGVMTDGSLYFSSQGEEIKVFNTLDGHGLKMLAAAGVSIAIISGRKSRALELRAENLGIHQLYQGVEDKVAVMAKLLHQHGLGFEQAGYMGDDVVDLPLMRACGFAATVPDGHELVANHAHYTSKRHGGRGAVREVCEFILAAKQQLDRALAPYLK